MNADDLTFEELGAKRYDIMEEYADHDDDIVATAAAPLSGTYTYSVGATPTFTSVTTSSTSTVNTGVLKAAVKPPQNAFDLVEMGIQQVGSFDANGAMTGWIIVNNPLPTPEYPSFMNTQHVISLMNAPDYFVFIRGIYSKYFTNERRAAMGLTPLP